MIEFPKISSIHLMLDADIIAHALNYSWTMSRINHVTLHGMCPTEYTIKNNIDISKMRDFALLIETKNSTSVYKVYKIKNYVGDRCDIEFADICLALREVHK